MKQKDFVIDAMKRNGGYATFQQLNGMIDFSTWGTKTPFASIRRIVQVNPEFFRVQPGLWALRDCEDAVLERFHIDRNSEKSIHEFTHAYFQGMIVEIGNLKGLDTYVPPQDKNRLFLETRLSEMTTMDRIFDFTYPETLRKARTVDTIWFNERKMPCAFYEVEYSTDMKNSLNKFYELQDFRAKFFIIAAKERKAQFEDTIHQSIYRDIRDMVEFVNYDALITQYNYEHNMVQRVI